MAKRAVQKPELSENDSQLKWANTLVHNVVLAENTMESFAPNNTPGNPGQRILNAEMQQIELPGGCAQIPSINVVMPGPIILPVGPESMRMKCYHCDAFIKTTTVKSNNPSAHLACYLMCFATCCCCWIPYCMDTFKRVDHYCPACGEYLGSYNI